MKRLFVFLLLFWVSYSYAITLNLGTGSKKGTYYKIGLDMKRVVKKYGIKLNVINTKGSMENILGIAKEKFDMAIVQVDALLWVETILKEKNSSIFNLVSVILKLYPEEIHILTKRSDIDSIYDIRGKNIAIGPDGSGTSITAIILLGMYNINANKYNLDTTAALRKLKSGDIAAMFFVGGAPVKYFKNLPRTYRLIRLPESSDVKFYERKVITKEQYRWLKNDIATYSVPSVVVANKNIDKEILTRFVIGILENKDYLTRRGHKKWRECELYTTYTDYGDKFINSIIQLEEKLQDMGLKIVPKR